MEVFRCAKKGWELILLHADLTQVHEVEDEKEVVVVHPSQEDHWMGVVEVPEHPQEEWGTRGQDKPMHLHLREGTS